MGSETVVGIEALLGQERWVRRLARALVHDEDEADEVVQEARVAWWRQPPRDPERARSWFGTVVRNLVRNRSRAEGIRRRVYGELTSADEAVPSPERLAERLEIHRELAEAVSRLEEPLRQVVVLRYYAGLSSAEIARRLGEPAGTIRWRLKTGLESLRGALDERRGGNRGAWLLALGPLASRDEQASSPAAGAGGAASARPAWAWAGALASLAALGVTVVMCKRAPDDAGASAAGVSSHSPVDGHGSSRHTSARVPLLAASGAAAGPAVDDLPAWIQLEGGPRRTIAGRIVSNGRPIGGASVRLASATLPWVRGFDRHASSGDDGAFSFPVQPITDWFLTVWAPALEPVILYFDLRQATADSKLAGRPLDALVIELAPCRVYARGTVRDGDGEAIPTARVRVGPAWDGAATEARTDGAGHYELCVPAAGPAARVLTAEASGYGAVEARSPTESGTVDFVLEPQAIVFGRAIHKDSGEPAPGVDLVLVPQAGAEPGGAAGERRVAARREGRTDEAGRFELTGAAAGRYTLRFASDELWAAVDAPLELRPGEHVEGLEVRLAPVALVEGQVFRQGKPAPHADLRFTPVRSAASPGPRRTRADESGRFRVRLGQDSQVTVESPADPSRPNERWTAVLQPAQFVAGQPRKSGVRVELAPLRDAVSEASQFVTPAGASPPPPGHTVQGKFGSQVRFLGYDLARNQVARGGTLEVTLHFQVLAPLPDWRLFCHLVGPGGFVNLDHAPVRGAHPVARWRVGETIRDRFVITIPPSLPPGVYTLLTGFWLATKRLAISPAALDDAENRLRVLTLAVE